MTGVLGEMFGSSTFWFMSIILIFICVLPDLVVKAYRDLTDSILIRIAREKEAATCACVKHRSSIKMKHVRTVSLTSRGHWDTSEL